MGIIAKVGGALQQLFGEVAEEAAEASGVIRPASGSSPACRWRGRSSWGSCKNPEASDEELAQMAVQCGADGHAASDRAAAHAEAGDVLARAVSQRATKMVVGSDQALAPILERFTDVIVLDGSTIALPDEHAGTSFAGCGGSYGSGAAAMKLQTELDLRSGAVTHVEIEPGRSPDGATSRQHARRGQGSLRITDLGYFNVAVFRRHGAGGRVFSLAFAVRHARRCCPSGRAVDLLPWLAKQPGPFVDRPIRAGQGTATAVPLDRLASARGTGESPPAEIAQGHRAQERPASPVPNAWHGATGRSW